MKFTDIEAGMPAVLLWDPRIASIEWEANEGIWIDHVIFRIRLHCKRKVTYTVIKDFVQGLSSTQFEYDFKYKVQQRINQVYAELKENAGGSVDVYGHPIIKPEFPAITPFDAQKPITSFSIQLAKLDHDDEWDYWCKQNAKKPLDPPYEYIEKHAPIQLEGAPTSARVQINLDKICPGLQELVKCPACATTDLTLKYAIIHLNDTHTWDRMAVADWIESLDIDTEFKE